MSTEADKIKHSKRLLKDEAAVKKQVDIAKHHGAPIDDPHKFSKRHAMNCGDPKCAMCGNPRKFFGEKTIQEQRFDQDVENKPDKHGNGLTIKED